MPVMGAKKKQPTRRVRAKRRPRTRGSIMLVIPEAIVTQLIDPAAIFGAGADADDLAAATESRVDLAAAEIAQALVATGRTLSHLHVLRAALEERGFRRGYRDGALAAGWTVHALARDAKRSRTAQ